MYTLKEKEKIREKLEELFKSGKDGFVIICDNSKKDVTISIRNISGSRVRNIVRKAIREIELKEAKII